MKDLINELKDKNIKLSSATLSDVMDDYDISGVLSPDLNRLSGNQERFFGKAYTVDWKPVRKGADIMRKQSSTWEQVKNFLVPNLEGASGMVYVAGAGEILRSAALAGGMSSTYFQKLGFEGLVLGGAVRDAHDLKKLDIPVVASNFIPTDTQGSYLVKEIGVSTTIDNVNIHTGDFIFSDSTGTVVIPEDLANEVIRKALEIDKIESRMQMHLEKNLISMIESNGRI